MKRVAVCIVALGILLATAGPSLAHEWHGHYVPVHHHHAYPVYYGLPPVVVAPAPVYTYPVPAPGVPVVVPASPVVVPAPAAYSYGGPTVSFGYRGRGISLGVGL